MTDTTSDQPPADTKPDKTPRSRKPRKQSQYICVTSDALTGLPQQRETVRSNLLTKLQKEGDDGVEYVILREVARVKVQATTTRRLKGA